MCCLVPFLAPAACAAGAGTGGGLAVTRIAEGVYVHQGAHAEADAANRNDIANIGFVVGRRCVAVIDSGGSPTVGRRLRTALRRHTAKPVCFVINTHVHPDHLLGNRAFAAPDTEFVGHANLTRALAARGRTYLARLAETLQVPTHPGWLVPPQRSIADRATLDLGGRRLLLRAWPTAHTDNDLTVLDEATGTLFTGDLVFMTRVPALDGSITGWLAVLEALSGLDGVERAVPGHGPVSAPWPAAATDLRRYLRHVRDGVRRAIDAGRTMEYAIEHVGYEERERWRLFDDYHRRNVTAAFAELEWE